MGARCSIAARAATSTPSVLRSASRWRTCSRPRPPRSPDGVSAPGRRARRARPPPRTPRAPRARARWTKGSKPVPYGLSRLAEARAAGSVSIVEGASDAQTLWHHELPALGVPGAASWKPSWNDALDGIATVYVLVEPDAGGEAVLRWLATVPWRDRVKLVHLAGAKDVSALHCADPLKFTMQFLVALDGAEPYRAVGEAQHADRAAEALAVAGTLLDDPAILNRVAEAIRAGGFAGD